MIISFIAKVLGAATSFYMIICALRVFMTWMPGMNVGRAGVFAKSIVDPYLSYFSKFKLFKTERVDFSPIVALSVLSVANNFFSSVAISGRISLGFLASLVLGASWSAVSFILSFLALCTLARVLVLVFKWNSFHPLWNVIDAIVNPVLHAINMRIYRGRAVDYLQGLITGFIFLAVLRAAGGALVGLLSRLLASLPF
ncbi:MAG: hypothetical protein FD137_242 [Spirochaetes bacterium]|nr:MAG: hypothetical protein FD137_242 [Spirochaetota bacterium]